MLTTGSRISRAVAWRRAHHDAVNGGCSSRTVPQGVWERGLFVTQHPYSILIAAAPTTARCSERDVFARLLARPPDAPTPPTPMRLHVILILVLALSIALFLRRINSNTFIIKDT